MTKIVNDGQFFIERYAKDAVRFVKEVLGVTNIEAWQEKVLIDISNQEPRVAVGSGHGVGKTALTSWIILWFISTRPHPAIVVTANTESQLKAKTWRELAKWHKRAKNADWFEYTATKFFLKDDPQTWFASAIPWTENRSEAFAGTHEDHVLYLFDEASAIADIIWEVSEGAMTSQKADKDSKLPKGSMWLAFGNMTKNTGRFAECWGKFKHRWKTYSVDSREVSITDKEQIAEWIADYGDDSDFVRIRVKGQLPRSGTYQFISRELVENCQKYKAEAWQAFPVVFGCDIARFGDDENVICIRQGRKVHKFITWRGVDTMQTASRIVEQYSEWKPELMFIDGDGVGAGVVDRVKQLVPTNKVYEVNGGRTADNSLIYFNKRAEMWGLLRDAMKATIEIPNDQALADQLISPEYFFDNKNRIQLEKKETMKQRGLSSPDWGDALAMSYAKTVTKSEKKPHSEYRRAAPFMG